MAERVETLGELLTREGRQRRGFAKAKATKQTKQAKAKPLVMVRCQGCGAWVAGTRAIRWEMCDPRTERESTLWLCGLECPWLFKW